MKGNKNVMSLTAKERCETVAVVAYVTSIGVFMPNYVIFKSNNYKQKFREDMPPGTVISISNSSYIEVEVFHDFNKRFVPHKPLNRAFFVSMKIHYYSACDS
jgi:hypothetical protein